MSCYLPLGHGPSLAGLWETFGSWSLPVFIYTVGSFGLIRLLASLSLEFTSGPPRSVFSPNGPLAFSLNPFTPSFSNDCPVFTACLFLPSLVCPLNRWRMAPSSPYRMSILRIFPFFSYLFGWNFAFLSLGVSLGIFHYRPLFFVSLHISEFYQVSVGYCEFFFGFP